MSTRLSEPTIRRRRRALKGAQSYSIYLSRELMDEVERRVQSGDFPSRSDMTERALRQLIEREDSRS